MIDLTLVIEPRILESFGRVARGQFPEQVQIRVTYDELDDTEPDALMTCGRLRPRTLYIERTEEGVDDGEETEA